MKSYYLMLIVAVCFSVATGLSVASYYDKKVEKAFEKGVRVGKRSMQPHLMDTLILTQDPYSVMVFDSDKKKETTETYLKHLASKITVDSIEFKYDSIMVIHYNNSEVK